MKSQLIGKDSPIKAKAVFVSARALREPPVPYARWSRDAMTQFLRLHKVDAEDLVNWIWAIPILPGRLAELGLPTWVPPYGPEKGLWVYYRGSEFRGGALLAGG